MITYQSLYSLGGAPGDIVGDAQKFKRVDRSGFNMTDSVDTRFFKLLFYFYNDDNSRVNDASIEFFNGGGSGLLSPTWLDYDGTEYYKFNSAWAFLKNNYEEERADALKSFIGLLSNISSESPWYFQKITGVDEALSREKWKIAEERKKITIECLSDPVDHRIESLLSLYRSIVWSHTRKCEILPSNLRKFDMGLFVFSGLTGNLHFGDPNIIRNESGWASFGDLNPIKDLDTGRASYKYIEFHNCEIGLDSLKSGFGDINNEAGFKQTFSIDIYFDDCYEYEYNPFLLKSFGDFFLWDLWSSSRTEDGTVASSTSIIDDEIYKIGPNSDYYRGAQHDMYDLMNVPDPTEEGLLEQFTNAVKGDLNNMLKTTQKNAINAITGGLGNIYGQGMGIAGATDALTMELGKQWDSLKNKVTGNINGAINDASRSITSAVTTPVLGVIKNTGTMVGDAVQATSNLVTKPVLGTLKMAENASTRLTELGTSYVDQAGE